MFRVGFWNVAGLMNKDEDFWKGLREWDVIIMSQTWVDERGWGRISGCLPEGYIWKRQWAE